MTDCLNRAATGTVAVPLAASIANRVHARGVHMLRLAPTPRSRVSVVSRTNDQRPAILGFMETARRVATPP